MKYISVCSGIEAATVAWHPLGWTAQAYSEIEPFPCKVLAHHYPSVPNLGDMTKFKEWPDYANVDVLVGGTPCQSFSIAGLRKGLDDPRGNLILTYLAIADRYKPKYIVWENVPGVLSSNGGRDFATFLEGLAQLGYGWAYRVLDAQYVRTDGHPYAVPQRRRRVFVVGCLGDTGRAAAVLFDSESLRGNPPPRREAGKSVAHDVASCIRASGVGTARIGDTRGQDSMVAVMSHGQANAEISVGFAPTLNCNHEQPIAFTARGNGADATNDATPTMRSLCKGSDGHQSGAAGLAVAFGGHVARTLSRRHDSSPCADRGADVIFQANMQVRRLTPRECERLQAFPDDYTLIPGASDTTRYKALGNSMAVNVMQLIGQRIQMVNEI